MRVLSPQEFMLSEFPRREDLAAMMDYFEATAVKPFVGKEVYGGFRHGSASTGGSSILSDQDYFLVVNDERHNQFVKEVIAKIYSKSSVVVECIPYSAQSARQGWLKLEDLFLLTLKSSIKKHGFIGENPVALFQPVAIPFEQAVHSSLEHYITRLDRYYNEESRGESHRLTLLKEILNKPFDAVRNMLQYTRYIRGMDTDFNDSKPAMLEEYEKNHPKKLVRIIKEINSVMLSYVDFVEQSRKRYMHINGYLAKLYEIEALYKPARHFIRENSLLVGKE